MVCHSGVGLTPSVAGEIHHFSAGGLYNGLVLLVDDESQSYWDHISGRALHGPLQGASLPTWPIRMTSASAARRSSPELQLLRSQIGLKGRLMGWVAGKSVHGRGVLPPGFRSTMGEADPRLAAMAHGLGVVLGEVARFYPMELLKQPISDQLAGRDLTISVRADDGVPEARWQDDSLPMQLFSRWYGFSYTYPGCELYAG